MEALSRGSGSLRSWEKRTKGSCVANGRTSRSSGSRGVRYEEGRTDSASRTWRIVRGTLASILVVALGVAFVAPPAGAASLPVATPDSFGNYAACNINLTARSTTFSDGQTGIATYASGFGAYWQSFDVSVYCNTAFPKYGGQETAVDVWYGSSARQSSYADCDSTYGGAGCTWNADGHVNVTCPSSHTSGCGGNGGQIGCLSATYYTSPTYIGLSSGDKSTVSPYACSTALPHCTVQPLSGGWSGYGYTGGGGPQPCAASVSLAGGTALEPSQNWGTQTVVLPTVTTPVVACSIALNPVTGLATLTSTSTTPANATIAYAWALGDGTTASQQNVTHTFTGTSMPAGGWQNVVTVTATGDGVNVQGTSSATCTKVADLTTGSAAGPGGTPDTSSGGTAPPTSCGWFDVLCQIQQAAAWLFVPTGGFFTAWGGFLATLKTAVPFSYIASVVTWIGAFLAGLAIPTGGSTTNACLVPANLGQLGVQAGASGCPQGGPTNALDVVIRSFTTGAILATFAFAGYKALRKAIGEH